MPLSLSAEQKALLKIFRIEEQYIIPAYQRPYSWEYDHCYQLYNDLVTAFEANQDYFIGNIIIAKADNNRDILEVVDGQQRLITILLLFKVLAIFQPESKVLQQILEKEDWEGNNPVGRVRSDIFETTDGIDIIGVSNYDLEEFEIRLNAIVDKNQKIQERLCRSRFEFNIMHFYSWIKYFVENNGKLKEFTAFLLQNVYLLPIELSGATQEEANEKALVIFETINNRGMNLEDADIFKAKLYNRAKNVKEEAQFIELWKDFKNYCDSLLLSVDDVFRYYSHIIRGKEGITSGETNLREFFTNGRFSPLELKKYKEVLDDLFSVIGILELLNLLKVQATEEAKWIQIIDAYTNQYPKYAIVNYLYVNDSIIDDKFTEFMRSLTRYIYYQGSTSTVKFEIYNIIKETSAKLPIRTYFKQDISTDYFAYLGRLKKGFALLAFYLETPNALPTYNVDKIINLKDEKQLSSDWKNVDLTNIVDSLGNFLILDMPKKSLSFNKKQEYYSKSEFKEVRSLFNDNQFSVADFLERDRRLKEKLVSFFQGRNE